MSRRTTKKNTAVRIHPSTQIFVGGASLGGSDDLASALETGSLHKKLEEAKANSTPALPQELIQVSQISQVRLARSGR